MTIIKIHDKNIIYRVNNSKYSKINKIQNLRGGK